RCSDLGYLQFQLPGQAKLVHEVLLSLRAELLCLLSRTDVRRNLENLRNRRIAGQFVALEVMDGEAADLDRVEGVEIIGQFHLAAIERERGVEHLEDRTHF